VSLSDIMIIFAIGQHLLMSNLNNNDLADLLVRWFEENGLILKGNAL
jgi:hypothetical protein